MASTRQFLDRLFPRKVIPQLGRLRKITQNPNGYLCSDTYRFVFGRFPRLGRDIFRPHPILAYIFCIQKIRPQTIRGRNFNRLFRHRQTDVFWKRNGYYRHSEYDFHRFLPVRPLGTSEKKRICKFAYPTRCLSDTVLRYVFLRVLISQICFTWVTPEDCAFF